MQIHKSTTTMCRLSVLDDSDRRQKCRYRLREAPRNRATAKCKMQTKKEEVEGANNLSERPTPHTLNEVLNVFSREEWSYSEAISTLASDSFFLPQGFLCVGLHCLSAITDSSL